MKKLSLLILLFITCILSATDNYGVFQFQDYTMNDRAALIFGDHSTDPASLGMGSTDILNSLNANSLFHNPANMGYSETANVNAVFKLNYGSQFNELSKFNQLIDDQNIDYDTKFKLAQAAVMVPFDLMFNMKLALGAGWKVKYDMAYNKDYETLVEYTVTEKHHGGYNVMSLGTALSIFKIWSVGFTYNRNLASKYEADLTHESENIDPLTYDPHGSITGDFVRLGATMDFSGMFTAAIMYQPAYTIKFEESNTSLTDYEIDIPSELGIGFTFYHDYFKFTGEYRTKNLSDYKLNNAFFNDNTNDGFGLRLGLQFNTVYPTRIGFRYENERFYDKDTTYNAFEVSNETNFYYGFSGGLSVPFDRYSSFNIGFEYGYITWKDFIYESNTNFKTESTLHNFTMLVGLNLGL